MQGYKIFGKNFVLRSFFTNFAVNHQLGLRKLCFRVWLLSNRVWALSHRIWVLSYRRARQISSATSASVEAAGVTYW